MATRSFPKKEKQRVAIVYFFIFSNVGLQSPFKFFHHTPYRRPILSQSKDTFDGDAEVNLDISFLSSLP